MDTHVHAATGSGDATDDLGILANSGKQQGINALFITDHMAGSNYQISSTIANHIYLDDAYGNFTKKTSGTVSTAVNQFVTSPVASGTQSLSLQAASTTSGDSYAVQKTGPALKSGPIMLQFSVNPTRVDANSGLYVAVSFGGNPTEYLSGYTTENGTVLPGQSRTFVWQIGRPKSAVTTGNSRVYVNNLTYTLNQWNTYTIDVSAALRAAIPAGERPGNDNRAVHIKIAASATGGTASGYFDDFSLDASNPVSTPNEFIQRNQMIRQWDTSTFKMYPSIEQGLTTHTQQFNFDITDPAQWIYYRNGTSAIAPTQSSGFPAQLNHPGVAGGVTYDAAVANQGYSADGVEVRLPIMGQAWDAILSQGVQIVGVFGSDSHRASTLGTGTFLYAPSLDFNSLMAAYFEGRSFNSGRGFTSRLVFNLDPASLDPYPARYPVFVPSGQGSAPVSIRITGGLLATDQVRWVRDGVVFATESASGSSYQTTKSISLSGSRTYVRVEVYRSGSPFLTSQPIFFLDTDAFPTGMNVNVERVATANGIGFNKTFIKGIVSASWNTTTKALSMTLTNPSGSLVTTRITTKDAPSSVKVDGGSVAQAGSEATFRSATGSSWWYDQAGAALYVKARHADGTARVLVEIPGDSTAPPPPTNLTATVSGSTQVALAWTAPTTSTTIAGYNVYRNEAQIATLTGSTTTYTDTIPTNPAVYTYTVRTRGSSGALSEASNAAVVTVIGESLFGDGFEAGNMSAWTSSSGLAAQQAIVQQSAWAARGQSSGLVAQARKTLSQPRSDVTMRFWVRIESQGANNINLMKFRTATGVAIGGLYLSPTGQLAFIDDVGTADAVSAIVPAKGAWHEVTVRMVVNGAGSRFETTLDGVTVATLTKDANFGTTGIGMAQLGEHVSGRTFDIVFDDVSVVGGGSGSTPSPTATLAATTATASATTTVPSSALFSDGFEAGNMSAWTSSIGLVAQQTVVHQGAWAARGQPAGNTAQARKTLPQTANDVTLRFWFRVESQGANNINLMKFRTASGAAIGGLYLGSTGQLAFSDDVGTADAVSGVAPSAGAWHEVTVRMLVNGTGSRIETSLDGVTVTALTKNASFGTTPLGMVQLGEHVSGRTFDVVFDDAVVTAGLAAATGSPTATETATPIPAAATATPTTVPPTAAPTTATPTPTASTAPPTETETPTAASLATATATAAVALEAPGEPLARVVSVGRVSLAWSAVSGATSYGIYRDGVQVGTVTTASFTDTSAPSGLRSYQVRALASGTQSALSPAAVVFGDGFEGGSFANWSTVSGSVATSSSAAYSGSSGALLSSSGAEAYLRRSLDGGQDDTTLRLRFHVVSIGSGNLTLVRMRDTANAATFSLFIGPTGELRFRNETTRVNSAVLANVSFGTWHEISVRVTAVAGTAGAVDDQIEVRLDGVPVASSGQALGSTLTGWIQVGENSLGRVFEVAVDDVMLANGAPAYNGPDGVGGTSAAISADAPVTDAEAAPPTVTPTLTPSPPPVPEAASPETG